MAKKPAWLVSNGDGGRPDHRLSSSSSLIGRSGGEHEALLVERDATRHSGVDFS